MTCVVCNGPLPPDGPQFANAWERARKRYPYCGAACAEAFDPDQHWLPAVRPEPATDADRARLLAVLRARLADGDTASVVVREMLLAGVPAEAIRGVVVHAMGKTEAVDRDMRQLGIIATLAGLVGSRLSVIRLSRRRNVDDLRRGIADIEAWERHGALR